MRAFDPLPAALTRPLDALFGADERVFLPFLGAAALLAAVV